jgi:hypothetical protein
VHRKPKKGACAEGFLTGFSSSISKETISGSDEEILLVFAVVVAVEKDLILLHKSVHQMIQ